MQFCARLLVVAAIGLLCACSAGGSAGPTTTIPQPNVPVSLGNTLSVELGVQPTSVTLPVVSQITGTLLFPAVTTPAMISLSASATAPARLALNSLRRPQSGTLTVYEYLSIVSPITVTLPSIPAMTFHFPASTSLGGKSAFYGFSDLDAQGGLVSFNTQGPGTIDGQTVLFAQVPAPLTFEAGHRYTFVIYVTGTASVDGAAKIYVANEGDNTVTTYNADGTRTTPTITDGVSYPGGVAVDAAGKIYVANGATNTVTTYNADGTRMTPTITDGLTNPAGVVVDAAGKIYVWNQGSEVISPTVTTYKPDGTRTTPTITSPTGGGIAVDKSGKIYWIVGGDSVKTFTATGEVSTPTFVLGPSSSPMSVAVDAAGKVYVTELDVVHGANVTIFNPDGTPSVPPAITAGIRAPSGVAIDAAGKIYVVNLSVPSTSTGAGSVMTYKADGSQTTPTITNGLQFPAGIAVH